MIKKVLFVIGYFFLILALLEIATRVFFYVTHQDFGIYRNFSFSRDPHIAMPDDRLGWKLIPNVSRNAFTSEFQVVYTTNSIGLREKEVADTAKFKILFIGDSFTFGEGVPLGCRFSDLIEKEMGSVYTINAGVPAYGVHQMFRYLKYHGIGLRPNLVICTIISQDLYRVFFNKIETAPHMQVVDPGNKAPEGPRLSQGFFKMIEKDVLGRSYFLTLGYVGTKILMARYHLRERDKRVWKDLNIKNRSMREESQRGDNQKWIRDENFRVFRGMKKLLADSRTDFLVLNISREPIPWLSEFLSAEGIDFLDISSQMNATPGLRFKIDPHINSSGNRFVADRLKEYLLQHYKNRLSPVTSK
jgi:hypothetical protein